MANAAKRGTYVNSLDGLRALCCLGVVGYHMNLTWCQGGFHGVTILFVLSGYLATAGLLRELSGPEHTIHLLKYWKKRIWRLMPQVTVFIVVTAALCVLFSHLLLTKMRPDIIPGWFMVINWTKILSQESYFAAAGAPSPLTHFWTLAIEAQFYLVWPLVLLGCFKAGAGKRGVRRGIIIAAIISAVLMAVLYHPGEDPSRVYYGTDTRAYNLLLGCWLAFVWPFDRMSKRRVEDMDATGRLVMQVGAIAGVVLLVVFMLFSEGYSAFSYYGGIVLVTIVATLAIAALTPQGTLMSKVLSLKPLVWIGKRSYAVYIWHYPILELLNPRNATTPTPWWVLILELALILAVSGLSYHFIEQPFRHGWPFSTRKSRELEEQQRRASSSTALARSERGDRGDEGRERRRREQAPSKPYFSQWVATHLPVAGVGVVVLAIAVVGCLVVKPVTVMGAADDKLVTQASLKKPLVDGVYDVVLIGDSVSLGANSQLSEAFPHGMMDTKGERQIDEATEALQAYLDQGVVGDTVIFSIGTNGRPTREEWDKVVQMVGPDRTLWLVNIRVPETRMEDNNAITDEVVAAYPNVNLIDWAGATEGHDEWLIEDGIHLTQEGREAYTKLVVDTIGYELPNELNTSYDVTIMGDVVCLDAADQLAAAFPRGIVDSADGREPDEVLEKLTGYLQQNVVGHDVVFCIGNTDPLTKDMVEKLVAAAGADRAVWLVNNRAPGTWCLGNNDILADVAAAHSNVTVVDWYTASAGHDDYLAEDGLNLTPEGAAAYTQTLLDAMGRTAGQVPQSPSEDDAGAEEDSDEEELDEAA